MDDLEVIRRHIATLNLNKAELGSSVLAYMAEKSELMIIKEDGYVYTEEFPIMHGLDVFLG